MKLKNKYFFTLREDAKEEDSISGNFLVKSGMIKKTSTGVYIYLPLGYKVLNNIRNIINEEMKNIGSEELLMPTLISESVYEKSGRNENFGNDMFRLNDRYDKKFILGPTHEELFAIASSFVIKSYKDLHFSLHQFQNKFRDEARPRFGLVRLREFLMKDAYSFDVSEDMLDVSYQEMKKAYINIFNRTKINYSIVTSDTGAMGGLLSEEFQGLCDKGEDTIVTCPKCSYASNIDIAKRKNEYKNSTEKNEKLEEIFTPNVKTIKEISEFLNENEEKFIKTLIYKCDNEYYAVLVLGNDEVNETSLKKILKASTMELATFEEVKNVTGSEVGFVGPVNIGLKVVADEKIKYTKNMICGANKINYHFKNVNVDTDFKVDLYTDLYQVKEGDLCPKCGEKLNFSKSIEIGNIFKLGTKYSECLDVTYTDEENKLQYVYMGSYGIGLGRTMATIVEQHYDKKGIIWPYEVAPYKISIVVIDTKNEKQMKIANDLYDKLTNANIDALFDDREERPGIKFNDMDLIGIPYRVVIGKNIENNIVEFKRRDSDEVVNLTPNELIEKMKLINNSVLKNPIQYKEIDNE